MFDARLAELRSINTFLQRFCADAGIERAYCLRLNVVLEELFVNTVQHGHGRDSDAPVWVTLAVAPETVHVTYEDSAPPFNPYAWLPRQAADGAPEARAVGGLGVLLTKELAAKRDYAYVFGRNRIRLAVSR
jgi:serine/threonine-protein kinase RsbW